MSEGFRKCKRLFHKFTQLRGLAEDEPPWENLRKSSEEERKMLGDKPLVDSVKRTCGRVEVLKKVDWNVPLHLC
jgi:hypothetical protein